MIITIRVKTNAKEQKIEKMNDDEYKVYVKSPPKEGEANQELIKLLEKHFKQDVRIIRGLKNKKKVIELS